MLRKRTRSPIAASAMAAAAMAFAALSAVASTGCFYVCQAATEDSSSLNSRLARCLVRQRRISLGVFPSAARFAA